MGIQSIAYTGFLVDKQGDLVRQVLIQQHAWRHILHGGVLFVVPLLLDFRCLFAVMLYRFHPLFLCLSYVSSYVYRVVSHSQICSS
jgi:hypothetical protein